METGPSERDKGRENLAIQISRIVASRYRKTPFDFDELCAVAFLGIWSRKEVWRRDKVARYFYTRAHGAIKDFLRREISNSYGVTATVYRRRSAEGVEGGKLRIIHLPSRTKKDGFRGTWNQGIAGENAVPANDALPDVLYLVSRVCKTAKEGEISLADWDEWEQPQQHHYVDEMAEKIRFRLLEDQRARFAAAEQIRRSRFDPRKNIDRVVADLLKREEKRPKGVVLVQHTYRSEQGRRRRP